ncbi:hypothetical protein BDR05DRAFT_1058065 [Suillus weaverae]|nr:hypothetical protein BDR05DRAFT_1058065 [Suillus weaverae]
MHTVNSEVNFASFSDTVTAPQNITSTPGPTVITERQQQLDGVLHEISRLEIVVDSIKHLSQQLVENQGRITQSLKLHKRLPLSLEAWCHTNSSATKLRSFIQPYIHQISPLSVHFSLPADKPELIFKDSLPALQELTIYASCKMPLIARSISQLPFTMRSLKVTWPLFNIGDFSTSNHLLAHLTNLELAISQLKAVPHLLHLCPNLSSLTICVSVKQRLLAIESFTHTQLRSLRIAHDLGNAEHLAGLFDALSLPNLRLLEAHYIEPSQVSFLFDALTALRVHELAARAVHPWPHEQLATCLARSNCPLKTLVFGAEVMTTDEQRAEYITPYSLPHRSSGSHV